MKSVKEIHEMENTIVELFNKAIVNPENQDAEEVDGVNWNFVEADVYLNLGQIVKLETLEKQYDINLYDFFEGLADEFIMFGEVHTNSNFGNLLEAA